MTRPILIADDEPFLLDMVEAKLTNSGFRTLRASDGAQALAMMAEKPQAVVLDAMMPIHDGFHVLSTIKSDPETASTPVIMLTALRQDEHILRALRAGADDFVTKPFNPDELVIRLMRLLPRAAA